MKKTKFKHFIKNVEEGLKFFLLFAILAVGFLAIYWTIWMLIGWPLGAWSIGLLIILALLSDFGYYRWIDG
jgi:hypothetical protein